MKALIFLVFQSGVWGGGYSTLVTVHFGMKKHLLSRYLFKSKRCFLPVKSDRGAAFFSAAQSVSMAALRDSLATISRISWLWNFSIFFTSCAWSVLYSKHCKRKLLNIRFHLHCFYPTCSCNEFVLEPMKQVFQWTFVVCCYHVAAAKHIYLLLKCLFNFLSKVLAFCFENSEAHCFCYLFSQRW